MEIVKKLNLNKTPKDLENGSIVCAKNMMVDDTGSFLTQDTSLVEAFRCDSGERIVGVIPCGDRIVILTDGNKSYIPSTGEEVFNSNIKGRMFIKPDIGETKEVYTYWTYEGGTSITGAYTETYKNEIVLAIAESGANKDVPLKSFIIHDSSITPPVEDVMMGYAYYTMPNQTYSTEEDIPKVICTPYVRTAGMLICGVYTFFIRYKVDTDNYTKWFPITPEINIIRLKDSKCYTHRYLNASDTKADPIHLPPFTVNAEHTSDKCISLDLNFDNVTINEFQIGYIIKVASDVQGRILGNYNINNTQKIDVINNIFLEEANIDDFLEEPRRLYNVNCLCAYNNRLYLAGYKEYDNIDFNALAKQVIITSDTANTVVNQNANVSGSRCDINLTIRQYINGRGPYKDSTRTDNIHLYDVALQNGQIIDTTYFINELKRILFLLDQATGVIHFLNGDIKYYNTYEEASASDYNLYLMIQKKDGSNYACIIAHTPDTEHIPNWGWDFTVPSYTIHVNTNSIDLHVGNDVYTLFGEDADNICILGYNYDSTANEKVYWFGNTIPFTGENVAYQAYGPQVRALPNTTTATHIEIDSNGSNVPSDSDDGSQGGGYNDSDESNVNNRTLIPRQWYNFFIHYIRKDGSSTLGYRIGEASFRNTTGAIIIPRFTNIIKPSNEFIGWFITYEEVERHVDCAYIMQNVNDEQRISNAEYMYDLGIMRGTSIVIGNTTYPLPTNQVEYHENRLLYKHIKVKPKVSDDVNAIAYLTRDIDRYKKEVKILYRATKNVYEFNNSEQLSYADRSYLPDYYNKQILIKYTGANGIIIDPAVPYAMGFETADYANDGKKITYDVEILKPKLYSPYPTEAMNIKEDFVQSAVVLDKDTDADKTELVINTIIPPDKLHDFLELQNGYRAKPSKTYANYRKEYTNKFNKTIYRSDVVSDESLTNGFRRFESTNYKNILENKGKITNIVGIGLYLLVHTEYSLFVFDRSPQLTQKYQMNIPDTFDIDYQEVLASNEGYGGLQNKEESIVTKNGYIWYDKANKLVFLYVSGKSAILSADINNFIKNIPIKTVRFAEDILHNRVMMCFTQEDNRQFTISFSFETKSFVSLHDYSFTNNYRTYNVSYLFDKSRHANVLYKYDHSMNIAAYGLLKNTPANNSTHFKFSPEECYVDIIFNEEFHISKVLNSISYVLNKIKDFSSIYNIAEESMNRRYSGYKLQVYTDETASPILDIDSTIDENEHLIEDITRYDRPVWDKGKWIFDYFRNVAYNNDKNDISHSSDINSMIFGKYFVVRFIFNKLDRVKLDTIEINSNLY